MAANTTHKKRKPASARVSRAKPQASSRVTTDHDQIRSWVEARGGHPATVAGTRRGGSAGVLRIDFPGYRGERRLRPISWDAFFEKFEDNGLAFLFQNKTATGRESRFSKLIRRKSQGRKKAA